MGAQEGLLERVLAFLARAQHVPAEAEQRRVVAVVELLERLLVAFRGERGEAIVGEAPESHSGEGNAKSGGRHGDDARTDGLTPCPTRCIGRSWEEAYYATICSAPGRTVTRTSSSSATWSPSTCHGTGRPSAERMTTSLAPSNASTRRCPGIDASVNARMRTVGTSTGLARVSTTPARSPESSRAPGVRF